MPRSPDRNGLRKLDLAVVNQDGCSHPVNIADPKAPAKGQVLHIEIVARVEKDVLSSVGRVDGLRNQKAGPCWKKEKLSENTVRCYHAAVMCVLDG